MKSMQVRRFAIALPLLGVLLSALLYPRTRAAAAQGTAPLAQNVVSAWYPIELGDTWVYQKESDDGGNTGGRAHPMIERWKTEETIAGVTTIPEGTLITKRTKVFDRVMLNGWPAANDRTKQELPESHLLMHQNCLYVLDGVDGHGAAFVHIDSPQNLRPLDQRHQLVGRYRDDLLQGKIAPDFCFPMVEGMTWGDVPDTSPAKEWVWSVQGINADPFGESGGQTFHLTAHAWAGTDVDRWFEPGVGVLQEIIEHHGHFDEDRRQLLQTVLGGKSRTYDLKPARTAV